jgi:glucose uptake protein GlcU
MSKMIMFSLGNSNDAVGFLAALVGSLCYGSYGVPIKATQSIDVHPLVLQSYRTIVVFVASTSIVRLFEEPTWASYGLLAGLFEVCGGTAGIVAIRKAGIATAIGTWASVMIVVNFVWGILIFREPVRSISGTCGAFAMLGIGLIGMTKFSSSPSGVKGSISSIEVQRMNVKDAPISGGKSQPSKSLDMSALEDEFDDEGGSSMGTKRLISRKRIEEIDEVVSASSITEGEDTESSIDFDLVQTNTMSNDKGDRPRWRLQNLTPFLTERQFGIACAILNGILGASAMVPLHYSKNQGFSELSFISSFVSGVLLANMLLWAIFVPFHCFCRSSPFRKESLQKAFDALPQWYVKDLWFKLLIAGLLLTVGMFGSVLAISSLGQAVGNSLIQSKILISGLWGICFFQEIKDRRAIRNWFLSATLSIASILWLSFERQTNFAAEEIS